ncbi:hypothetical protein D3C87_1512080 [compost metagenome]
MSRPFFLFFDKSAALVTPELGVSTFFVKQLGVRAIFDYRPFIKHDDAVEFGDG